MTVAIYELAAAKGMLEAENAKLLEALKNLVRACDEGDFDGMSFEYWCGKEEINLAREAIAMAEAGGSP